MALIKLGDYIEPSDVRNKDLLFGARDLKGLSINKVLINTKADASDLNLSNYKIIKHNEFSFCTVTSRNGNKISLAYNDGDDCIISSINPTFKIKDENKLNPRFLMMFFNRTEFDRYARFNSWGSARESFTWDDMCDIELDLPSIEIQRKYVAIYEGLLENLKVYESKLEDLKLVCDGYIEDLRKKYSAVKVGTYIEQYKEINSSLKVTKLAGLIGGNIEEARTSSGQDNLAKFQIVYPKSIVYPPPHFGEIGTIGIVKEEPVLMSPMYITFRKKSNENMNIEYLLLWFRRKEFMRYAFFASCDSIRDTFDFEKLCEYKIPIPPLEIQNSIVEVFNVYNKRKEFVTRLKNIIKDICPILIRGTVFEENKEQ